MEFIRDRCSLLFSSIVDLRPPYYYLHSYVSVFSINRGETQSRGNASTIVANSRYDYNNRHHESIDPLISVKIIGVVGRV